jgi:hypothetical protein
MKSRPWPVLDRRRVRQPTERTLPKQFRQDDRWGIPFCVTSATIVLAAARNVRLTDLASVSSPPGWASFDGLGSDVIVASIIRSQAAGVNLRKSVRG